MQSIQSFDIDKARKVIEDCLRENYYWHSREWQYKNVKPRIIAEEYLYDTLSILPVEIQDFWCEAEGGWLEEDCTVGVTVQFSFMFDMKWSSVGKNCVTNPVSFRNRLDFIWEKGSQYLKRFQDES